MKLIAKKFGNGAHVILPAEYADKEVEVHMFDGSDRMVSLKEVKEYVEYLVMKELEKNRY